MVYEAFSKFSSNFPYFNVLQQNNVVFQKCWCMLKVWFYDTQVYSQKARGLLYCSTLSWSGADKTKKRKSAHSPVIGSMWGWLVIGEVGGIWGGHWCSSSWRLPGKHLFSFFLFSFGSHLYSQAWRLLEKHLSLLWSPVWRSPFPTLKLEKLKSLWTEETYWSVFEIL